MDRDVDGSCEKLDNCSLKWGLFLRLRLRLRLWFWFILRLGEMEVGALVVAVSDVEVEVDVWDRIWDLFRRKSGREG